MNEWKVFEFCQYQIIPIFVALQLFLIIVLICASNKNGVFSENRYWHIHIYTHTHTLVIIFFGAGIGIL